MTGASEATQDICPDCCGTGGGHPDNLAGKCYRCDGTGGIPKTTEGGEGLSVKEAAKRIGISKSALYEELRKVQEEGGADDLEESDGP